MCRLIGRMPGALIAAVVVVAACGIVVAAHSLGRRAGTRETMPWRPIFQLVEHRTRCLGQPEARVRAELGPILGVPSWAWDELAALRRPFAPPPRPLP